MFQTFKKFNHVKDSEIFKIEMALPAILAEIKLNGICVYKEEILEYKRECEFRLTKLLEELQGIAQQEFSPASNKETAAILKNKYNITLPKTDKFNDTVEAEALAQYKIPFTEKLLEFREYNKQVNTYINNYQACWVHHDEQVRVHPDLWQIGTVTGRMSCKNPNVQNVPTPIKRFIGAPKGKQWVFIDYSQIEYRLFAHYSHDVNLIKGYWQGEDYHQKTADMLGIPRKKAKTINFGILYGMGSSTLAKRLEVTKEQAGQLLQKYHENIEGLGILQRKLESAMRSRGYITTAYGRKLKCTDSWKRVNWLIQGTAVDIIKIALIKVDAYLKKNAPEAKIVAVIHDELIIELPEKWNAKVWLKEICALLYDGISFSVPIEVNAAYTDHAWIDKQEVVHE